MIVLRLWRWQGEKLFAGAYSIVNDYSQVMDIQLVSHLVSHQLDSHDLAVLIDNRLHSTSEVLRVPSVVLFRMRLPHSAPRMACWPYTVVLNDGTVTVPSFAIRD